jgi:hypothetical protein
MKSSFARPIAIFLTVAAGACGESNPEPETPVVTTTVPEVPSDATMEDDPEPTPVPIAKEPEKNESEYPPDCQAWIACMNSMDEPVRESFASAFEQWRTTYEETTIEGRKIMGDACTQMMVALHDVDLCR